MYEYGYDLWSNVGFAAEAIVANVLTGLVGIGLIADGYIFTNDGYGVIPIEVGNMEAGKWSGITISDDKPVRVLRVDFDRTLWMLNPRNTKFRRAIDEILCFKAASFFPSLPLFP